MTSSVFGQINTPAPSPSASFEQAVGLSTVSMEYSRPSMKGRTIFGELVPFDKIWRTGANASTKITFSDDVKFGGLDVPAGTYALYTKPGKTEWTVMVYKDLKLGGAVARYDEANELGRFTVTPQEMPMPVETMLFVVDEIKDDAANIYLMWEKTVVPMNLEVNVNDAVMGQIKSAAYQSAVYYYNTGQDLDQALNFINVALEEDDQRYWMVTWKARILAKMGNKKEAIKTSEKAMALAQKANNMDYVKINKDLIAGLK